MKEGQCQREGEASTSKTAANVQWVFMFFSQDWQPQKSLTLKKSKAFCSSLNSVLSFEAIKHIISEQYFQRHLQRWKLVLMEAFISNSLYCKNTTVCFPSTFHSDKYEWDTMIDLCFRIVLPKGPHNSSKHGKLSLKMALFFPIQGRQKPPTRGLYLRNSIHRSPPTLYPLHLGKGKQNLTFPKPSISIFVILKGKTLYSK